MIEAAYVRAARGGKQECRKFSRALDLRAGLPPMHAVNTNGRVTLDGALGALLDDKGLFGDLVLYMNETLITTARRPDSMAHFAQCMVGFRALWRDFSAWRKLRSANAEKGASTDEGQEEEAGASGHEGSRKAGQKVRQDGRQDQEHEGLAGEPATGTS